VALLLALFVIIPTLEAAACPSDLCGVSSLQVTSVEDAGETDRGQTDQGLCVSVCHCSHLAVSPVQAVTDTVCARTPSVALWPPSDEAVSNASSSLERPPRI